MDFSNLIEPDDVDNKPYIFVSYSRQDMQLVQNVIKILKDNNFRFWYDKGLKSGVEWAEEIGDKIDRCDQFLVLISSNSVNSKYVRKEIGMAIDRNKNILVVYLEETKLTNGLYFLLGNIHQTIHKASFDNEDNFADAICKEASNNTLYQNIDIFSNSNENSLSSAKSELLMNYSLLSKIGAGGICQVFNAVHKRTGNLVAVKCGLIDENYLGTVTKDCFELERIVLTKLMGDMCPYIPMILDWFEDDKQIFIVETMVYGESLEYKSFYSEKEIVEIAKKVLKILQYLHNNNIIHRDIKPSNLIKDKYGEIHLIYFNTAMVQKENNLNKDILGTVGFASPEQYCLNSQINFSSDIYELGRTMEYLLCPEHFYENTRMQIRYYRKDISVELEAILDKMTAHSQSERYQNVGEVLQELEKYKNTNLLKKFSLLVKSRIKIKKFKNINKEKIIVRKEMIHRLAVDSQSCNTEDLSKTVILFETNVNDSVKK